MIQRGNSSGSGFRMKENSEKIGRNRLSGYEDIQQLSEAGIAHEEEILDQDGNYVTFTVTPFRVDMELSYKEFRSHTSKCNHDFKENIMKQVQTIKLKDTDELSKKVSTSLIIN